MSARMMGYLLRRRQDARDAIAEAMHGDGGVTPELHNALIEATADVAEYEATMRARLLAAAARDEQAMNNTQRREDA